MRPQVMLARTIALAASVLLFGGNTIHAQNGAKTAAPATDAAGQAAPGQNAVEGLDVSTESGKVILKLKLKDPMANVPASFSLANPPRVAFDFPNTVNALGKTAQDVNENDVKSVRIGESGGRTRVVLNLITNGFYAATRRATEAGNGFEPVLKAATKNLGDAVEIRIRDNGTGIPPEVRDKIFNPFFTTKPAGEGTGLGLSMSHDIVVKQHGGTIDVATEPGAFTEFIITLPRRARGLAAAEGTVN